MAERSYDLDHTYQVVSPGAHAEITLLTASVAGEALCVEKITIWSSVFGQYSIRKYVGATLAFEWDTPAVPAGESKEIKGPWNLLGDPANPQSLRLEFVPAVNTETHAGCAFSRE